MNLFYCLNCISEKINQTECQLLNTGIVDIIEIIQQNYLDNQFNINDLSDKAKITRRDTWDKIFSKIKIPLFYLVENKRIEKALELLTDDNHTVSKIAYSSGFHPVNMRNVFKRRFGLSPSKLQELILTNENRKQIIQNMIFEIWNTENYRYETKPIQIPIEKKIRDL
jgi:transcriptional regulator GlxA family with amidase domain